MSARPADIDWFQVYRVRFGLALESAAARTLFGRLYAPFRAAEGTGPVFALDRRRSDGRVLWQISRDSVSLGAGRTLGEALRELEYAICTAIVEGRGERLVLHGAAVYSASGCAFITGYSEAGKTTLSLALAARGYTVGGDDASLLDPITGDLLPVPRCAHLDERSRRLLRRAGLRVEHPLARRYRFITPADLGAPVTPAPLRHIVLLTPGGGGRPELTPISQAEAALALLREAGWENEQTPMALAALARLAGGAASYRLARGRLRLMVDLVAGLLGPAGEHAAHR